MHWRCSEKGCRQLSHEGSLTLPHRQEYSPSHWQNISKPPNLHNVESTCTHLQFDDDNCVFFGGNNGTSLDCLSWVNCFAISPIASCKKQILPRDIIARWWWYSIRHQLTAAVRVARVFFSLFWETLFCNGWLWSIEGSLQTCLSFVLQTDHKMHVKVSFLLLQDQRIIKNYFFCVKVKKQTWMKSVSLHNYTFFKLREAIKKWPKLVNPPTHPIDLGLETHTKS